MPQKLRYEFYLPFFYPDKKRVEQSKFRQVKNEITKRFGGVSIHQYFEPIDGQWRNEEINEVVEDTCCRFEVVVDNTNENKTFFREYKQTLKDGFKQKDIFMVYTEIESV